MGNLRGAGQEDPVRKAASLRGRALTCLSRRVFLALGYLYRALHHLPVAGKPVIRGIGLGLASAFRRSPHAIGPCADTAGFRQGFERMVKMLGLSTEVVGQDEAKLEVVVKECPYGFRLPGHAGVCMTAMEMDRTMAENSGMRLVVEETVPTGAAECRMTFYLSPAA